MPHVPRFSVYGRSMPNESSHEPSRPASRWRFNPCCTTAYDEACAAFTTFVDPDTASFDYGAAGAALGHGSVAPALATHMLEDHDGYAHHLTIFGEQVALHAPDAVGDGQEHSRTDAIALQEPFHAAGLRDTVNHHRTRLPRSPC